MAISLFSKSENPESLGFGRFRFSAELVAGRLYERDVYTLGDGDKTVLIIQELPGIGPQTLSLAKKFADAGYYVVLPHLLGTVGKVSYVSNFLRVFCMRQEFALFSSDDSSPVVNWLKSLCAKVKADRGNVGIGVIGMCLTGNFAISLIADDAVLAAYASQPSLPFHSGGGLHLSEDEIVQVRDKLDKVGPMMCARFKHDPLCRNSKFEKLEETFNKDKLRIQLDVVPGVGHSILTLDFVDKEGHPTREVLERVIQYFDRTLQ